MAQQKQTLRPSPTTLLSRNVTEIALLPNEPPVEAAIVPHPTQREFH